MSTTYAHAHDLTMCPCGHAQASVMTPTGPVCPGCWQAAHVVT